MLGGGWVCRQEQGCVLSPWLFFVYVKVEMEYEAKTREEEAETSRYGKVRKIPSLYAEDI